MYLDHGIKVSNSIGRSSIVSTVVAAVLAPQAEGVLFLGDGQVAQLITQRIASARGKSLKVLTLPQDARIGDIAAFVTNLAAGDYVFVDDVENYSDEIFESLHQAIRDATINITIGEGDNRRSITLDIQPFLPFLSFSRATARVDQITASVSFLLDIGSVRSLEEAASLLESNLLQKMLAVPDVVETNCSAACDDLFNVSAEMSDIIYRVTEINRAIEADYQVDFIREKKELKRRVEYLKTRNRDPQHEAGFHFAIAEFDKWLLT